ncbi:hypothetical protein MKX01_017491, partial [Papaver californicum]
ETVLNSKEDNFSPWMILDKKKNKNRGSLGHGSNQSTLKRNMNAANRFASLAEHSSMDQMENVNRLEIPIDAQKYNIYSHNNVSIGGNDGSKDTLLQSGSIKGKNVNGGNDGNKERMLQIGNLK